MQACVKKTNIRAVNSVMEFNNTEPGVHLLAEGKDYGKQNTFFTSLLLIFARSKSLIKGGVATLHIKNQINIAIINQLFRIKKKDVGR